MANIQKVENIIQDPTIDKENETDEQEFEELGPTDKFHLFLVLCVCLAVNMVIFVLIF